MSDFDWIAAIYGPLEIIIAGRILQRARAAHIDALAGRQSVLSAGEGHGRFAALCARAHPDAQITCVDASEAMLAQARRRTGASGNVRWIHAALPGWRPEADAHDAIVTCFFLDCFGPATLPAVIDSLAHGASRNAIWLHVDFELPPRGVARLRARACLALMHAFFRIGCGIDSRQLEPVAPHFARHGFKRADAKSFNLGLITSTLWSR
jgi:cyclopropane fatty-acyl-phospholipid synthase-like methyltransferase